MSIFSIVEIEKKANPNHQLWFFGKTNRGFYDRKIRLSIVAKC
jgi:hypothetical protein